MSRYDTEICPFCDKLMVPLSVWDQASRLKEDDPAFVEWDKQFCWSGWEQPGECVGGLSLEDRLVQVLEQRDALAVQLAEKLSP